ncbi:MAG: trigger factor [Oligoflexia bacterium]|nr:trigger factor [Oligoflexia bacterium]
MELTVKVEETSSIVRKLIIKVPAKIVANRFEKGLQEVQRTAKLKGFRPGNAPLAVIKQYYGDDVRHRLYHSLIDESFQEAVRENKLMTVGRPTVESPEHQHGQGEHDHAVHEEKDFVYTATVEIMPEVEVKGYTGIPLKKDKVEVTEEDVKKVVDGLRDSQAQLNPVSGGLVGADGKASSRPVQKGDFVDLNFSGGLVTATGIDEKPGMKGSRIVEIGSESLIPGFEDNLVGMRSGETKTFRVKFPADFPDAEYCEKDAEFTATVNEVKEKILPELNDEFAKSMGYEGVADMQTKAREYLTRERTDEADRKIRNELVQALIEKTPFDVPNSLVEAQTRALAQDWAEELKRQGVGEQAVQQAILAELENMKKRAENQVRASLILEAVAKKENVEVKPEEFEAEVVKAAEAMRVEVDKLKDFYAKNPGRKEDFLFRLRQESTLKFLLDKAKIKSA